MLGIAPRFQRALVLYGPRGTGKSTFLKVLGALFKPLGAAALASVDPKDWINDNHAARLMGARLNVVGELDPSYLLGQARFKTIVDGDALTTCEKYQQATRWYPRCAHAFAANELPMVPNADPSFWDRWVVLGLDRHFRGTTDEVVGLGEEIVLGELPGVVAWAVTGAQRLPVSYTHLTLPTILRV